MQGYRRRSSVLRDNRQAAETWPRLVEKIDEFRGGTVSLTPKAVALEGLVAAGVSFEAAFEVVSEQFTEDGLQQLCEVRS